MSIVSSKTKILLIGDARVGKTSLRKKYMGQGFRSSYAATMGAEFSVKKINDNIVTIYDLAGDPKSRIFRMQYYPDTQGILIIFDISERKSFANLIHWINEIKTNLSSKIVIFILGNKVDLVGKTLDPVDDEEAYKFSKNLSEDLGISVSFLSTSALTGYNVDVAFSKILAEIEFKHNITRE